VTRAAFVLALLAVGCGSVERTPTTEAILRAAKATAAAGCQEAANRAIDEAADRLLEDSAAE
jgi:hypothetical protein